ncbi:MAG: hypothetical protein WC989_03445 [Micavibrio sp.]
MAIKAFTIEKRHRLRSFVFLMAALCANILFWTHSRTILPEWNNVSPPPSASSVRMAALGDPEIAYRMIGYFLQNAGNTGGRYESLKDYNYTYLEGWFGLAHALDPRADLVPFLTAYYFGALENEPGRTSHVARALIAPGLEPYPEKWRWLAHAVYLARFRADNIEWALELANKLAGLDVEMAAWGRQMPAFVQLGMGDKKAAYEVMVSMLATEGDKLHPAEVNFMREFICERTLEPQEAAQDPLCENLK